MSIRILALVKPTLAARVGRGLSALGVNANTKVHQMPKNKHPGIGRQAKVMGDLRRGHAWTPEMGMNLDGR